jgi:hypothetical protein
MGYTCACGAGFSGEGTTNEPAICVDLDGCDGTDCGADATCTDVAAPNTGYTCVCGPGLVDSDGTTDEAATCVDVDDCDGTDCGAGATCTDIAAPNTGYTCACGAGLTGEGTANEPATCVDPNGCSRPVDTTGYASIVETELHPTVAFDVTAECAVDMGYVVGTAVVEPCPLSGGQYTLSGCSRFPFSDSTFGPVVQACKATSADFTCPDVEAAYGPITSWDVSAVTDMGGSAPHTISSHAHMSSSHWLFGWWFAMCGVGNVWRTIGGCVIVIVVVA